MKKWSDILERIDEYRWKLPKNYKDGMRVDGLIFADESLMEILDQEEALEQVANVAFLPGIVKSSMAMPDIHWGYGFPVGGVAAFDAKNGVISPGGIGYDINCGMRLIKTNLTKNDVKKHMDTLVNLIFSQIPCGAGAGRGLELSARDLDKVLREGGKWAVERGLGESEDIIHTEGEGCLAEGEPEEVSNKAKKRGGSQLGTLGSGNHFIEIQAVQEIFDEEAARIFGLKKDMITIMIHTGSRGVGHQVATDYLKIMAESTNKYGIILPDRQLACAPINSPEGSSYLAAMAASANFAFANRQVIAHRIREIFEKVFKKSSSHLEMDQIYDVAHNIAKFEDYIIDGKKITLCVHRKGATRSFGPGSTEIPPDHRSVGQAVIIPGDMGRYSYLLAGTNESAEMSFSSTCHGAGRVMGRHAAVKALKGRDISNELAQRGIIVKGVSRASLAEEAPEVYKDVSSVVNTAHGAGLARRVAKMKPLGVIKG